MRLNRSGSNPVNPGNDPGTSPGTREGTDRRGTRRSRQRIRGPVGVEEDAVKRREPVMKAPAHPTGSYDNRDADAPRSDDPGAGGFAGQAHRHRRRSRRARCGPWLRRLGNAFPTGVCDYRKPGVAQQPSVPCMTFADGPGGARSSRLDLRARLRSPARGGTKRSRVLGWVGVEQALHPLPRKGREQFRTRQARRKSTCRPRPTPGPTSRPC
jgi:hypothetical protein